MLNEAQQRRVWEGMLGSEIRANYFAELAGKYLRNQQWATWGVLLFSSSDAASFLAQLPPDWVWIRMVLAMLAAATSIYLALAQNERKAIDSTDLQARWSRLHRGYESIWEDVEAKDAIHRLKEFSEQEIEASRLATSLANNESAMLKWQLLTEREHQARLVT